MKVLLVLILAFLFYLNVGAQTRPDSISEDMVRKYYQELIQLMKRIEIDNSGGINAEVYKKWQDMVNKLQSSEGEIVSKNTQLIKESLSMETLSRLITIGEKDSVSTIKINPNAFFEEMKAVSEKVSKAAVKMAESGRK